MLVVDDVGIGGEKGRGGYWVDVFLFGLDKGGDMSCLGLGLGFGLFFVVKIFSV